MNEVWGRCAEEVSLDLTGSFWTNLLPRVKNEATIKVFASQASEESDWETTAYGLSKRLVSRSSFFDKTSAEIPGFCFFGSVLIRSRTACFERAGWQSGHAAACKAVYAGSIPTLASRRWPSKRIHAHRRVENVPAFLAPFSGTAARVAKSVDAADLKSAEP